MMASGFRVRFPPIISPLSPGNSLVVLLAELLFPCFWGAVLIFLIYLFCKYGS